MGGSFYLVYDWMTKDLCLRGNEEKIFALIYSFDETRGGYTGSTQYLADRAGVARQNACVILKKLLEKGLIEKTVPVGPGANHGGYRISASCRARIAGFPSAREPLDRPVDHDDACHDPLHMPVIKHDDSCHESLQPSVIKHDEPCHEALHNNKEYNKENNKRDNKEREAHAPVLHSYGEYENVLLSEEDLAALRREFPRDWRKRVDRLSEYMASTGKTYRNHLATIRAWARQDAPQEPEPKKLAPIPGGLRL